MSLPELQRMMAEMFGTSTRARVAANPRANRKVTFTEPDKASRRYWEYTNGKGQRVRFYRSVHRNIAGYFIIWRETTYKGSNRLKNDMVRAFKSKKAAINANRKRYDSAKAKLASQ